MSFYIFPIVLFSVYILTVRSEEFVVATY